MFKRKWLVWTFILALLSATHSSAFFGGLWSHKTPDSEFLVFYQTDGQIYVGIGLPENMTTGNFDRDCKTARSLKDNEWIYITTGPVPGVNGYTGFLFRVRAADEEPLSQ